MNECNCSVIVDRIDVNNDSFVDLSELKNWIQFTQRRYIDEDVDRQWRQHNKNSEDFVQWEVRLDPYTCGVSIIIIAADGSL